MEGGKGEGGKEGKSMAFKKTINENSTNENRMTFKLFSDADRFHNNEV